MKEKKIITEKKEASKDIDEKEKVLSEYKDHLQRLQAEFDNYRKRMERDNEEFCKFSNSELIHKLLAVLDSFELALQNKDKTEDFVNGIELIYSQLYSLLEKEGLRKIESLNKKFDANYHEVLLTETKDDVEENKIMEELQKGYMINSKVLRYAKVKISKRCNEKNDNK